MNSMHLIDLPFEILIDIIKKIDSVETENELLITCRTLKNAVLLGVHRNDSWISPSNFSKNAFLYSMLTNSFPWVPSAESLEKRLTLLAGEFLHLAFINHVILAGGAVSLVLDRKITDAEIAESTTDLDFFIYGTQTEMETAFHHVMLFFKSHQPYYFRRCNVIDVFIKDQRPIQLVFCIESLHPYDIIARFDLGFVQTFFDGKSIYARHLAVAALAHRTTVFTCLTTSSRIAKAERKGFQVINKNPFEALADNVSIIRNRFLIQSIKKEIDLGNTDLDVIATLLTNVQWEDIKEGLKVWRNDSVYGRGMDGYQHYSTLPLERITCSLSEKGSMLDRYNLQYNGFGFPKILTNTLRIVTFDYHKYNNAEEQIVVHESPFSAFVERFKVYLNTNVAPFNVPNGGFRLFDETDRFYDDTYLRIKRDDKTEMVDQYMTPYKEQLNQGDKVVLEVSFRIYGKMKSDKEIRRLRLRSDSLWEKLHFTVYAERIIVLHASWSQHLR